MKNIYPFLDHEEVEIDKHLPNENDENIGNYELNKSDNSNYTCAYCNKLFKSKIYVKSHQIKCKMRSINKTLKCKSCEEMFHNYHFLNNCERNLNFIQN